MEPGILKLAIRRGQSNFSIVFIFVGYYHVVWVGQLSFVCRWYCGRSRCVEGKWQVGGRPG